MKNLYEILIVLDNARRSGYDTTSLQRTHCQGDKDIQTNAIMYLLKIIKIMLRRWVLHFAWKSPEAFPEEVMLKQKNKMAKGL